VEDAARRAAVALALVRPEAGAAKRHRNGQTGGGQPGFPGISGARAIRPADAWCEDPNDRHYNQPIRIASDNKGDRLQRADHLYDFIVELDHNTRPRVAGRGSAVFLHLARDNFGPTAGCVAMTKSAMLRLLRRLGPRTRIMIG